jgi:hypothetical protein
MLKKCDDKVPPFHRQVAILAEFDGAAKSLIRSITMFVYTQRFCDQQNEVQERKRERFEDY